MRDLDVFNVDQQLVAGRWGSSNVILEKATDWYGPTGVDSESLMKQTLHPVAHYAALLSVDNDTDDLLPSNAIEARRDDSEPRLGDLRWTTSARAEDNLLRDILSERNPGKEFLPLDAAHLAVIDSALAILDDVLPALSRDVLSYVSRVALTDADDFVGATMRDFPYVVLLGPEAFESPKLLAQSLLHESLHSKVIMIERSALIQRNYDFECTGTIAIPWRVDAAGNYTQWPVETTFMAYHVYGHLTVMWTALWQRDNDPDDLDRLRRVCFRAAYLSKALREHPDAQRGMGEARLDVVRWLDELKAPAFGLSEEGLELVS